MTDLSLKEPFGQLEIRENRGASFGASFLVQSITIAILVNLTFNTPQLIARHYETVVLTAPADVPPEEAVKPLPKPRVEPPRIVTPSPIREARIQPPAPPVIDIRQQLPTPVLPVKPKIPIASASLLFEPNRADLPPIPKTGKPVVTNNFGTGSSANPTLGNRPAREVQTGGFGDPDGVPASGKGSGKGLAIAKLGSWDLPGGSGYGNGTGGAHGARGTVVSAGFGNGTAIQDGESRPAGQQQKVVQTAFKAPEPVAAPVTKRVLAGDSGFTPFTILSKPLPSYTAEGRKRRIEGEVQLEVVFQATGHIRIVRIVHGLGYGLDEAAIAAAQKIQFLPARRGGQPVDAEARIRMVFQLT